MPNIGPMELIIVLVIALLILGPKRLPAAGRSLGRGITEFKAGLLDRGPDTPAITQPTQSPMTKADASQDATIAPSDVHR